MAQKNGENQSGEKPLLRLEEAVAFNERTIDELNKQVVDLHQKLERLSGRIIALETRVAEMLEEPTGPNAEDEPERNG